MRNLRRSLLMRPRRIFARVGTWCSEAFVDNPQEAVNAGDELVAQVIESLADTFSTQRSQLESELKQTDQPSTENLRLALRRYRSFFERLLSI